jgi:hypothetical protein
MGIISIAIIIAGVLLALILFRLLGGCLVRLLVIALIVGAALFIAYQIGWR